MDDETMGFLETKELLDEINRDKAKQRKIAWIKFAIVAAVTVALVGMWIGIAYAIDTVEGLVEDTNTGIVWMSISGALLGNLALYTVADTLLSYHSKLLSLLKTVLKIAGIGLMVVSNLLTIVAGGMVGMLETNPWIIGLYGTGYMGATICGLAFYWSRRIRWAPKWIDPLEYYESNTVMVDNAVKFNKLANPFVPFASLIIGYLLSVIFAYIGNAVHSFFYVWFSVLLCVGAIVASVVVYSKKFKRSKKHVYSSSKGSENNYNSEKKVDSKHEDGDKRMRKIFYTERLLPYASELDLIDIDWESPPKIDNYNFWWNSSRISISGKIKCTLHKGDISYKDSILQKILDETAKIIRSKVRSVLEDLCREYSNYGKYEINCDAVKISTCNFR